jgi:hypothetical protein
MTGIAQYWSLILVLSVLVLIAVAFLLLRFVWRAESPGWSDDHQRRGTE